MNVYLIFAHPEPKSFNGRLKDTAVEVLTRNGHTVQVFDLFEAKFGAYADRGDYDVYDDDFFDLQRAQQLAADCDLYPPEIRDEHQKLLWADLIILQFPMWWQSVPGPLKGYFDRVLTVGFAYGGTYKLAGKKALVCMTTGTPGQYLVRGQRGDLIEELFRHLFYGTLAFCQMEVLQPVIAAGSKRWTPEEKEDFLEEYVRILERIEERERLV